MNKLFCIFVILAVFVAQQGTADAVDSDKPNIVLFFVDDFGQRDLSCYGSSLYETPHMDRLAAESMRFTDAYSAYPRCVPSRQGLLTGKYPCRIENEAIKSGDRKHHVPLSEVTFGEALKEHGYQTCYIGKWHLGKEGGGPGDQGFDTVIHAGSAGATGDYFFPFPTEKGLSVVNPVDGKDGDYLTDRLTDKAVEYVQAHKDAPFLMVMAHYAVHTPIQAPEDITKNCKRKLRKAGIPVGGKKQDEDMVTDRQAVSKTVQNNPTYAAMVEKTDDSLGRIIQALKDAGVDDNTVIILTSDHGGLSTRGLDNKRALATSNAPFRQGKGSIFEGGTRVPLIVNWPGKTKAGTTSAVQVTGTDHYPTMLEIAGAALRPNQHVDGRSYAKALHGETYQRDAMFWYKWQARPDSTGDTRALSLIEGNYKLVQWIDEDLVELFDLNKDIGEQRNLASDMPDRTAAMSKSLIAIEASIGNLRDKGAKELQRRLERKRQRKNKPAATGKARARSTGKTKKVFLFAGQSNMEGRANGGQLDPKDLERLKLVGDRVQFYYNHQPVTPLQLTTPAKHIRRKFELQQSFGPELFFGILLAEKYPDDEFVFIKRSQGGTSLYGCWNPNWDAEKAALMDEAKEPKLFSDFVEYGKGVLSDYDKAETKYEIRAMLWVQGESDSSKKRGPKPAAAYGENLRLLISESRKAFHADMPFMMFQVGNGDVVKGMQETAANDQRVTLIPQSKQKGSPDFYKTNPPPLGHYTALSMKRIGQKFFEAWETFSSD